MADLNCNIYIKCKWSKNTIIRLSLAKWTKTSAVYKKLTLNIMIQ